MLALQYLFANATPERPGLYLATVSEPFDKVVRYGQTLSFFDPRLVGRSVFFEDLARVVEDGGLPGVLGEINRLIRTRAPGIIVIDSFRPLSAYADEQEFRTFLTDLAGVLSVLDTSTFWVGEYEPSERGGAPEFAVADTIIALESAHHRERTVRELRVLKLRGSGFASGAHAYRLTEDGLRVFPRLADDADEAPYPFRAARVPSGVPALDDMLGEGYIAGASTLCIGPTGCGKTLVGLHLIFRGSEAGETGLIASFQENPSQLERVAASFGWTLADERVEVLYRSPVNLYIDEWVYDLLEAVERTGARRVMVDSVSDIAFAAGDEQRFREYLYSLLQRLSRRGVSLFMTFELPELFTVGRVSQGGVGEPVRQRGPAAVRERRRTHPPNAHGPEDAGERPRHADTRVPDRRPRHRPVGFLGRRLADRRHADQREAVRPARGTAVGGHPREQAALSCERFAAAPPRVQATPRGSAMTTSRTSIPMDQHQPAAEGGRPAPTSSGQDDAEELVHEPVEGGGVPVDVLFGDQAAFQTADADPGELDLAAARREVRDVSCVVAPVGPLEGRGPLALLKPANVEDAVRYRRHVGLRLSRDRAPARQLGPRLGVLHSDAVRRVRCRHLLAVSRVPAIDPCLYGHISLFAAKNGPRGEGRRSLLASPRRVSSKLSRAAAGRSSAAKAAMSPSPPRPHAPQVR